MHGSFCCLVWGDISLQQLCVGEDLSVLPAAEEPERRREEAQRADEEVEAQQRRGHLGHQDLKSNTLFNLQWYDAPTEWYRP